MIDPDLSLREWKAFTGFPANCIILVNTIIMMREWGERSDGDGRGIGGRGEDGRKLVSLSKKSLNSVKDLGFLFPSLNWFSKYRWLKIPIISMLATI